MPWLSRLLRGERIWARIAADGALNPGPDGRIDILYKKGGKVYRAAARNLSDDPRAEVISDEDMDAGERAAERVAAAPTSASGSADGSTDGANASAKGATSAKGSTGTGGTVGKRTASGTRLGNGKVVSTASPFIVYADGACTGNPGPAGLGVVLLDGGDRRELSEYLGQGTNNIAELMAIVRALEEAPRDRTVIVHSDSAYALGLLGKGWKATANRELVERMRTLAREFSDLRLVKVAGHAGIPENERADELARAAVVKRR